MNEIKNDFDCVEGTYIGIDFGTTNSVVTYFKRNKFEQVLFKKQKTLPSVIFFEENGQMIFGDNAIRKGNHHPDRVLKEFKRDLGTPTKYKIIFPINENTLSRTIVMDTMVLLNESDSDFLDAIDKDDDIYLVTTALDDLKKLKQTNTNLESIAEIVLEKLENAIDHNSHKIGFETGNLNDINEAIITNLGDTEKALIALANYIRTKQPDLFLVTNNMQLRSKAKQLGINVINSNEYKQLPKTELTQDGNARIRYISTLDASKYLLGYIKDESTKFLGEDIDNVVITVPANFSQDQTGIIKEAAEQAGFKKVRLLKEPIAVGYAYALHKNEENKDEKKNILVYDFGGGTFDVSLLSLENSTISVISTDGDAKLGGKDITDAVVNLILDIIQEMHDVDLFDLKSSNLDEITYNQNMSQIRREAEQAKIKLSDEEKVQVLIPNLRISDEDTINIDSWIMRKDFENAIIDIRKKTLSIIQDVIKPENIDMSTLELVVAGGSSHIPCLMDGLEKELKIKPKMAIDTSTVISQGATVEAMREWGHSNTLQEKIISNDTSLYDFGIGVKDHVFDLLIPAKEPLPTRREREYTTEKDNQDTINIRAYQRKANRADARRTYQDGINFIDEIIIEGIPTPNKVGDYTIKVIFELTKDDTLVLDVKLYDSTGNLQDSNQLNATRVSNS